MGAKKQPEQASILIKELKSLQKSALASLKKCKDQKSINEIKISCLGKKGSISSILKQMGGLDREQRPKVGKIANIARDSIEEAIKSSYQSLQQNQIEKQLSQSIDVTLPGQELPLGHEHPIMLCAQDMLNILNTMGFEHVFGPEIEHDFYNFQALNIPADHPARDMQDTFYVDDDVVLRTHTSPVQIRAMMARGAPPIRVTSFGRVYRKDEDSTHSPMFHQIEGLYVAKSVSFADLKGVLVNFLQQIFDDKVDIRLRPSFFPFTEPSVEIDIRSNTIKGKYHGKWLEVMGAGMVDPQVYQSVGYDKECSGFAFGVGVERIAMLRYGISDIRDFFENDLRLLSQF